MQGALACWLASRLGGKKSNVKVVAKVSYNYITATQVWAEQMLWLVTPHPNVALDLGDHNWGKDSTVGYRGDLALEQTWVRQHWPLLALTQTLHHKQSRSLMVAGPPQLTSDTSQEATWALPSM